MDVKILVKVKNRLISGSIGLISDISMVGVFTWMFNLRPCYILAIAKASAISRFLIRIAILILTSKNCRINLEE